jgi:hypothetical protein
VQEIKHNIEGGEHQCQKTKKKLYYFTSCPLSEKNIASGRNRKLSRKHNFLTLLEKIKKTVVLMIESEKEMRRKGKEKQ